MPRLFDWEYDGNSKLIAVTVDDDGDGLYDFEIVRHGRWEWYEYWGDAAFRDPPEIYDAGWACSACGTELLQYLQSHFPDIPSYAECASEEKPTLKCCPNCGAKMDGGTEC